MMNADYLSCYPTSERLYQLLARGNVCDRPAQCGPSIMLTGADAAGNNPVLLPWPANPKGLPASKEEPGECCGKTRSAMKTADCREEARGDDGTLRSSAGGRDEERSRIPGGGETWNDVTETAAVQEAQREDTSHASGEGWHTQVPPGTI
ncbi:hypothetical protein NDU88_004726 [Pleurodeles waltl]|uniref:Uncharacterized protein n=1 Tax=Pleurodeles waltl TaxID=8319 RepID=A0AAV7W9X7_PLEWA|nr:hypothetical protein NDU88_004726 [Pleurodeles waltl]